MSNIERFIRNWSFAFKGLIFTCWMCWGLQAHIVFKNIIVKDRQYQKSRDYKTEFQNRIKFADFMKEKVASAESKGVRYGHYDYYKDLIDIDMKEVELGNPAMLLSGHVAQLQNISNRNLKKGYFTNEDFYTARDAYFFARPVDRLNNEQLSRSSLCKALNWLKSLYLKSLLLSFLLYLVRISEWGSIPGKILADKKKFLLAVFGWFYYLFKYPNNVLREVRVEAELRKVGNFFRKLTHEEKETVREFANSENYHGWIVGFRREYKVSFERTLAVALVSLVMSNMLFATCANGGANLRDGPPTTYVQDYDCGNDACSIEAEDDAFIVYLDSKADIHLLLSGMKRFSEFFHQIVLDKKIDRVPIVSRYAR